MNKPAHRSTRLIGGYLLGVGLVLSSFGLLFGLWLGGMESWNGEPADVDGIAKPRIRNSFLLPASIVLVGAITTLIGLYRLVIPVKIKPPLDIF